MAQVATFLPMILLLVVFYFLLIRPQNKQQKKMQDMRDNMKVGDEVLTIGGFYGIIYAMDDKNVVLEMLPDFNKAMVLKTAIARVITAEESVLEGDDEEELEMEDDAQSLPAEPDYLSEDGEAEEVVVEAEPADDSDDDEPEEKVEEAEVIG